GALSTMSFGSGDQTSAEGDTVWLQPLTAPTEGEWFYGQEGLPPGLIIDSSSGVIQGTIAYNAAEVQGGIYPVTVTATSLTGGTISQSFTWTVIDTQTPPQLGPLADLTNAPGDGVAVSVQASDADGDPLTYGAGGLPPGLSIDPGTGLISGMIATTAP